MLHLTPFLTAYILTLQGMIGAVLGSFLGCLSYRLMTKESILRGRSHCDSCGHTLSALDLIPMFSYIGTKGRCRYCGSKIPFVSFLGELLMTVAFVLITYRYDLTWTLFLTLFFVCILYVVSMTDLYNRMIPDGCLLAAIVVRFLYYVFFEGVSVKGLLLLLSDGLSISLPVLLLTLLLEWLWKKEAMGGGDIKLLFVTGLYLGWKNNLLMLFFACIAGIIGGLLAQKKQGERVAVPFGPYLALGSLAAVLWGDRLIAWYLSLFY